MGRTKTSKIRITPEVMPGGRPKNKIVLSLTVGYEQDMHIHFLAHLIPLTARLSPCPSSLWKYFWLSKVNINSCQQKSSWLKPLVTLQQLYINDYSAVRYCQEKSGHMILQWNLFLITWIPFSYNVCLSALPLLFKIIFSILSRTDVMKPSQS